MSPPKLPKRIIDSHAHIGFYEGRKYPCRRLVDLMNDSEIAVSLVSNLDGVYTPQRRANEKTRRAVQSNPGRLFGLVWANPNEEAAGVTDLQDCLDARETFKGVKFHPTLNKYAFDDEELVTPFLNVAAEYDVPIVVHTVDDSYSHPRQVYTMAKKHPRIKFIMYHMGLYDDTGDLNREAIRYSKELDNLYVETSWVKTPMIVEAVKTLGADKVIFGTDAPFDGEYHYPQYLQRMKDTGLGEKDLEKVMYSNSKKLFKI